MLQNALIGGLSYINRGEDGVYRIDEAHPLAQPGAPVPNRSGCAHPLAEPLDSRWIRRLTESIWRTTDQQRGGSAAVYWEAVEDYDILLVRLADPSRNGTTGIRRSNRAGG